MLPPEEPPRTPSPLAAMLLFLAIILSAGGGLWIAGLGADGMTIALLAGVLWQLMVIVNKL